jgi:hypothetical protein
MLLDNPEEIYEMFRQLLLYFPKVDIFNLAALPKLYLDITIF